MSADRGVLYVATQNLRCLAEAANSAASLKHHLPDLPVTVVTDTPALAERRRDVFDSVQSIEGATRYAAQWRRGLFDKVRGLVRPPYERTLFLDTDTRIFSERVSDVFDWLDDYDLALMPCSVDDSRSRQIYARSMLNTGVIGYRRSAPVTKLLAAWEAQSRAFWDLAEDSPDPPVDLLAHVEDPRLRRWMLQTDQVSLAPLLSEDVNVFGVRLLCLDRSWNWRWLPPDGEHDVKIAHCMEYKVRPEDAAAVLGLGS